MNSLFILQKLSKQATFAGEKNGISTVFFAPQTGLEPVTL
ncbi:MAG: hypothetical protein RLZZ557_126 [Bacteroidota bacterium]